MTKSDLFKKAHALTKATIKAGDNYRASFALCLKAVIADSKAQNISTALPALVGSEKQVAWADKIRQENLSTINYLYNMFKDGLSSKNHAVCANVLNALVSIRLNDQASFWINNGKIGHDFETKTQLFTQLADAMTSANPHNKIVKTLQALKQHGYI